MFPAARGGGHCCAVTGRDPINMPQGTQKEEVKTKPVAKATSPQAGGDTGTLRLGEFRARQALEGGYRRE